MTRKQWLNLPLVILFLLLVPVSCVAALIYRGSLISLGYLTPIYKTTGDPVASQKELP